MVDVLKRVNWVDCFIILVLIRSGYVGMVRGIGWSLIRLIDHILIAVGSVFFYIPLSQRIVMSIPFAQPLAPAMAFFILFFMMLILFRLVYTMVGSVLLSEITSGFQKCLGMALGIVRGTIFVSLILVIFALTKFAYMEKSIFERSLLGKGFIKVVPVLYDSIGVLISKKEYSKRSISLNELIGRRPQGFHLRRFSAP